MFINVFYAYSSLFSFNLNILVWFWSEIWFSWPFSNSWKMAIYSFMNISFSIENMAFEVESDRIQWWCLILAILDILIIVWCKETAHLGTTDIMKFSIIDIPYLIKKNSETAFLFIFITFWQSTKQSKLVFITVKIYFLNAPRFPLQNKTESKFSPRSRANPFLNLLNFMNRYQKLPKELLDVMKP